MKLVDTYPGLPYPDPPPTVQQSQYDLQVHPGFLRNGASGTNHPQDPKFTLLQLTLFQFVFVPLGDWNCCGHS